MVIYGSAPLVLRGLKGKNEDLDVLVKEDLWNNLEYFLSKVIPVCEECDVKMAIHPDDPPWDIFGLPRLLVNEDVYRIIKEEKKTAVIASIINKPGSPMMFSA